MSFTIIGRSYGPQVEPKVEWTALSRCLAVYDLGKIACAHLVDMGDFTDAVVGLRADLAGCLGRCRLGRKPSSPTCLTPLLGNSTMESFYRRAKRLRLRPCSGPQSARRALVADLMALALETPPARTLAGASARRSRHHDVAGGLEVSACASGGACQRVGQC
jgi:hypothetical protein